MKNILVILGHPSSNSFCGALADTYAKGAQEAGHSVKVMKLGEMEFDPVIRDRRQLLEPCLTEAQENISWASHIVFVYPNWWGLMPALMKGFIDRTFLEGFAADFPMNGMPVQLLKGRTAHLMVTMDTPLWFYRFFQKMPGHTAMRKTILEFCGIKVKKITGFAIMKTSTPDKRKKWLADAERAGLTAQ